MNPITQLLLSIQFIGLPATLRIISATLLRDWYEHRFRAPSPATAPQSPGDLLNAETTPRGGRFTFANAELEIHFLTPHLVRISWSPGQPPLPYAIAKTEWPAVNISVHETGAGGYTLASGGLTLTVLADGGIVYRAGEGDPLRAEHPPRWEGAAWTQGARLDTGERIHGLGERAAPLNLRETSPHGNTAPQGESITYQMRNTDPGGHYVPGDDPLYLNIPLYISRTGRGSYLIFYENTHQGEFSFGEEASTVAFKGGMPRYYFTSGTVAEVVERYTELTGRAPLPPRWALGYHQCRWGYKSAQDVREVVAGFREHNLPLDAIHLDIDYMDGYRVFTVDEERFPDLAALTAELKEDGIHTVTILDPGVKVDPNYDLYREGVERGLFCTTPNGKPIKAQVWPGMCHFPDFTNPETREWWGEQYAELLAMGVDGFWHDMNEPAAFVGWGNPSLPSITRYSMENRLTLSKSICHCEERSVRRGSLPVNNRAAKSGRLPHPQKTGVRNDMRLMNHTENQGGNHTEANNIYGLMMNQAGYEGLRKLTPPHRPWILSRAGWAGMQRYAWNWTGDVGGSWDTLRQTLITMLNIGLSGIPYTGSDIGGFGGHPSAELFTRWFQMAAFTPFFRGHSATGTPRREPWVYGEPYTSIIRDFLNLRRRLMPYLYTLAEEAAQTGAPLMRPLFWHYPEMADVDDQFMLGDSLLVAPVLSEGAKCRRVTLPPGVWHDWWDESIYEGESVVEVAVGLERIPVFVRGGRELGVAR